MHHGIRPFPCSSHPTITIRLCNQHACTPMQCLLSNTNRPISIQQLLCPLRLPAQKQGAQKQKLGPMQDPSCIGQSVFPSMSMQGQFHRRIQLTVACQQILLGSNSEQARGNTKLCMPRFPALQHATKCTKAGQACSLPIELRSGSGKCST